jgi:hypothetical protein
VVTLKVPKLRSLPFETAIIERYRRREPSEPSHQDCHHNLNCHFKRRFGQQCWPAKGC